MKLIDSHAHLDHVENLDSALAAALSDGVSAVLAVSTDLIAMKKNLTIKNQYQSTSSVQRLTSQIKIYLGLGVHPGEIKAEELAESYAFIEENIAQIDVIGEIGLDFWYKWVRKDDEKKREQRQVFRQQLVIAKKFDKPVVVHARGTWKECLDTVKEFDLKKVNFHWYSGPVDVLEQIIKSGYYVSASPALAFSSQSREAISCAPIEQTLIETDSPVYFNYPDELGGGFSSTPKDVFKTLAAYAKLKGIVPEQAAEILNKNVEEFLGFRG
jgi:TatD DNase family protein